MVSERNLKSGEISQILSLGVFCRMTRITCQTSHLSTPLRHGASYYSSMSRNEWSYQISANSVVYVALHDGL